MAIIDSTYFINDIILDTGTTSNIAASITKYEKELMLEIFEPDDAGEVLAYTALTTGWVKDVVEGKSYLVGDVTYTWVGLKNSQKESAIAYYVYYHHLRNISAMTGGIGNAQMRMENAVNVSFGYKIQSAWNRLENHLEALSDMLAVNYPEKVFNTDIGNVNMFDL